MIVYVGMAPWLPTVRIVRLAYLAVYHDSIWYLSFLHCIANVGWLLCQKVNLMKSVFGVLGDWMIGWYFWGHFTHETESP